MHWLRTEPGRTERTGRIRLLAHLFGLLVLLTLLAGGCGRFGRAEPTPTPVELSLVSFGQDGAWRNAEGALIDQFHAQNPHVTFDRSGYSQSPDQYLDMAPPPDIMLMVSGNWLTNASAQGRLLNVSDLWEQAGLTAVFPPSLQALSQVNGNQHFLPLGYGWTAIYYNEAIFADLGLSEPQTWDEFLLLCDTLQANGITPLSLAGGNAQFGLLWFDMLNLRINGPDFHRQMLAGEHSMQDERVRAVVEVWQQLFARGYFIEDAERIDDLPSLTAVIRGDGGRLSGPKAAMVLADATSIGELPLNFQAELGFFRFPAMDTVTPVAEALNVYGYITPVGGDHVDDTLAFLAYVASAPAQTLLVQQFNQGVAIFAPSNTDVDENVLSSQLRKGMALASEADDVVSRYVLSMPFTQWFNVERALWDFARQPDRGDAFMQALEAIRTRGLEEGWLLPQQP